MADISWIKLSTGLPDNKKIKRIRKLPDGDKVILFWVFLLARAGESNRSGGLFLTETLPYTEEDFAAEFDFTIEVVHFAIITLEKYGMITRYEQIIFIKNWEEYQSVESMEKVREQNRLRQAKFRDKQKLLTAGSNVISNVTGNGKVTQSNGTELDKELDKEKELKDIYTSEFESFWKCYPKKTQKKKAKEQFLKLIKNRETLELFRKGFGNYLRYIAVNKSWYNPQELFRWICDERFNDEYDFTPPKQTTATRQVKPSERLRDWDALAKQENEKRGLNGPPKEKTVEDLRKYDLPIPTTQAEAVESLLAKKIEIYMETGENPEMEGLND